MRFSISILLLHNMRYILGIGLIISCVSCYFISLSAEDSNLKKVTFIPQWTPQAQFAGYYVALDMGIYEKYGIDLKMVRGGPDSPSIDFLKDGKSDFAT